MPEIMQQRKSLQMSLSFPAERMEAAESLGQGEDTQGMFEARMQCTGEDQFIDTKLLAIPQPLKVGMVDQRQKIRDIDGRSSRNADGF